MINGIERECVLEFIAKHLDSEQFHINNMNEANKMSLSINDPDDPLIEHLRKDSEHHRRATVAQRETIEELALLLNGQVVKGKRLCGIIEFTPLQVILRSKEGVVLRVLKSRRKSHD